MTLPEDHPPALPAPSQPGENLVDTAPIVTHEQRENDFNRVFLWRGKEIKYTLAGEIFYRDFRTLMGAPGLWDYKTEGDFFPEACRVLFCASFTAAELRKLRCLDQASLLQFFDEWCEKNIAFHEAEKAVALAREINDAIMRARTQPAEDAEGGLDGMGN